MTPRGYPWQCDEYSQRVENGLLSAEMTVSSSDAKTKANPQTASFLVRFWREPREKSGDDPVVRGYLRNLGSGEEQYIRDPEQLGVHILRYLRLEMGEDVAAGELGEKELDSSSSE